jgi:hypothetical protein
VSDATVSALLRSDEPLVVIDAPAGCGKTHQAADYAKDVIATLASGRLLILAHTHAACDVFAQRTKGASSKVEIRTIASLTVEIAAAYHKTLGLPANPESWAWKNDGAGFEVMAAKCAALLNRHPMIAKSLATRYPAVICDEHQDCTADQHGIVMALYEAGVKLRIFGDPMQRIYESNAKKAKAEDERWEALKKQGASDSLSYPHRWEKGSVDLGKWILAARENLRNSRPITLPMPLPDGLRIVIADNVAKGHGQFRTSEVHRKDLNDSVRGINNLMVLASSNAMVGALGAYWGRTIRIWEGHTRTALTVLVDQLVTNDGNAEALASAMVAFVGDVAVGFSANSHGKRFNTEVQQGCTKATKGKPANIQALAKCLVDQPTHIGVAASLAKLREFVRTNAAGFEDVKVDYATELAETIRLGEFGRADDGLAELTRRRTHLRQAPPSRILSTIHKAKGLEYANVVVVPCDKVTFAATHYARCRLYVALSRGTNTLTLVMPSSGQSPLFA